MLLEDVFESFRNKCIYIYELDLAYILSAPGFAWQAYLKKTKVELGLLMDVDTLLMVEKGIRGGIYHVLQRYGKTNNKYMQDYDLNTESSYLMYWNVNNLYGRTMSQIFPVYGFKWRNHKFNFYEEISQKKNEYMLELDVEYTKELQKAHNYLPFLQETMNIGKYLWKM